MFNPKSYILNGKGAGFIVVFLLSLILSCTTATGLYRFLNDFFEDTAVQSAINSMPTVIFKDGVIISPIYDKKEISVPTQKGTQKIIIDTASKDIDGLDFNDMLYITATKIYVKNTAKSVDEITYPKLFSQEITPAVMKESISFLISFFAIFTCLIILLSSQLHFFLLWIVTFSLGTFFNQNITKSQWGRILAFPWAIIFSLHLLFKIFLPESTTAGFIHIAPILLAFILAHSLFQKNKAN